MIAYKFLLEGRVAPFSAVTWPDPGHWIEAETVAPCRIGVHACRISQLPYWLRDELWEVELDGETVETELTVAARRGKLVRRIDAWNKETAQAFGAACAAEARRRAQGSAELEVFADDAEAVSGSAPPVAAFIAARLAELQDGEAGYDAERQRQAEWLANELELSHGTNLPLTQSSDVS